MKTTLLLYLMLAIPLMAQDIPLTGYTLTFSDEFDSLSCSINGQNAKGGSRWYHLPPTGPAGNYSASTWDSYKISVSGGLLNLSAGFRTSDQKWYTGQISSMDPTGAGFAQKHGYFSAKIRMPNAGTGAWPAFWLLSTNAIPNNAGQRLEIDIFEWYGKDNTVAGGQKVQQVLHTWNPDNTEGPGADINWGTIPGADPVSTWHIYGALVAPDFITWYIDGVKIWQVPTPTTWHQNPLFVMIDYGLGGGWPLTGEPYAAKVMSSMLVDWVRVYALPATPTPTPQPGVLKGYFEGYLDGVFIPQP